MQYNEIDFENSSKRIIEQAYVSANFEMTNEQKHKLIQEKFERARLYRQALEKNPVYED